MSLHGSLDEQPVLVTAVVVVVNIAFNRGNELFSACKSMPIIALTLQDSPEAFHRAVVNAAANTGHTLCHPGIQQFLVEGSAGVLESTVAVEQRVCIRIFQNSFIKRVKNQLVVISVTNNIADDSPVTQIENRTQIELVDNWTFIPLELRYIGQPLFVGMPRPEFPVQTILCCYLRVRSISGTTLFSELHDGLDMKHTAEIQNTFVASSDIIVLFQIIPDAAVPFVWMFFINLLNCR
mgnify:CR=1 FL=1